MQQLNSEINSQKGENIMAKNDGKVVEIGDNIKGLEEKITKARDKVLDLKNKRSEINAQIAEIRASMDAAGIPRAAFDASLKYFEQDPDKRQGFDNGYIIARKAMGLPVNGAQLNLFEEGDNASEKTATAH